MKFFANAGSVTEVERTNAYRKYLQSLKERLPVTAFEFATAAWHYDHSDHRCPHDSWVESLTIAEPARGERFQDRSLRISTRLLGAFHDGHLLLSYADVQAYSLESPKVRAGHGDWLVDEIRLSDNGFVLHEVLFSNDNRWLIEAKDISCEWRPNA
jgi:WD40 repeat protein